MLITPDKPVDAAELFPFLAGRQRIATRLHPRRGTPSRTESSMGGDLLWPDSEPWPVCTRDHRHELMSGVPDDMADWLLAGREFSDEPMPMVPILQLRRPDVARLPWRDDEDLFQLLWCPACENAEHPSLAARWRVSAAVAGHALDRTPVTDRGTIEHWKRYASDDLIPVPCRLEPEEIVDYPSLWELAEDEQKTIRDREARGGYDEDLDNAWSPFVDEPGDISRLVYRFHLGSAPGTKVGGWPDWIQGPWWPGCDFGHRMEHLLTIASWEFDGETWKTWMPLAEREVLRARAAELGEEAQTWMLTGDAHELGITLGDAGDLYVYTCTQCPDRPVLGYMQCS